MKVLAVGDIHCKPEIIDKVWEIIDDYNTVVFVGDYADDWEATPQDSINIWQKLKDFQDACPSKVKLVTGNHDYIYAHYTKTLQSGYSQFTQTLIDMPENRELREWLRDLPITLEIEGVVYSHAGLTNVWKEEYNDSSTRLWQNDSPIWLRPDFLYSYKEVPQVFGHTPSETCWEVKPDIWCIDTFSTAPDGQPIGDETVLEITDGKIFSIKEL